MGETYKTLGYNMNIWILYIFPGPSLSRSIRMSLKAPHTILEMAVESLLKNKDFDISVLQEMPMEFFPSLFKKAFNIRCMKILTALVASWPFPCLPVGAMMKVPDVVILQVVLAAIDMLLAQMVHLR